MGVRFTGSGRSSGPTGLGGMGPGRAHRQRRERLLVVGGGSVLFALFVIAVLLVYNNNVVQAREDVVLRPDADAEVAFGTVVLISPKTRIPKGSKLTPAQFREINWPRDQVPEGAVRIFEDIQEMYSSDVLPANQPVVRGNIAPNPPSFGIAELLPPGHRAITIEVDKITGVEGWATPGAHVDVYLTHLDPKEGVYKTRVAVEDAVVISYGGKAAKVEQNALGKTSPADTVTLAVPFEDSLKIQTAKAMGRITLALRNSTDVASHGTRAFSGNDWDGRRNRKPKRKQFVPRGFASYTENGGSQKQFVLGNDDKWWVNADDEE